jgi:CMP-2-keto-3-deoxyoctulosonic acid synthetase
MTRPLKTLDIGLWVATDDKRIYDAVSDFGGKAIMTSPIIRAGQIAALKLSRKII